MTNEEQLKERLEECNISLGDKADHAAIAGGTGIATGVVRGAITTGTPQGALIQGAVGGATGVVGSVIKDHLTETTCKEKVQREESIKAITPQRQASIKPVNVNANYLMQMQASRNRIMFKGNVRI